LLGQIFNSIQRCDRSSVLNKRYSYCTQCTCAQTVPRSFIQSDLGLNNSGTSDGSL